MNVSLQVIFTQTAHLDVAVPLLACNWIKTILKIKKL